MYENLAILAVLVLLYSGLSGALERTSFGGPLIFVAVGLLIGTDGLGLLDLGLEAEGLRLLAELTLALVLFSDAADADLAELRRSEALPSRLLLIGLPATIALGVLAGLLIFPELALLQIALLATLHAPTDAALGKAVVSDESVPGSIRTALNVESGLNDGICVPIFLAFLAMATEAAADQGFAALTLGLLAREIGIGAAVGLALVAVTVPFMRFCVARGWFIEAWRHLPVPALAVACFAAAQSLGGSGFIACFTGGLLFNVLAHDHKETWLVPGEAAADALSLLTWVAFGAVVIGGVIDALTWQVVAYALLSLTVIRMAPAFLALIGSGLSVRQSLFIGWFGPRGLATIVFTVMLVDAEIPGADTIALTATCTIILSVVAHGLTAKPLIRSLNGTSERT